MNDLESFYNQMKVFPNQEFLGVFVDNHDNARFLSINNNLQKFKSYVTFVLSCVGIPIFYYGGE